MIHLGELWKKRERLRALEETAYKYYCSVCLIIRDENEYLKEWFDWHISLGIEHFYIYDHGSKEPVSEYIKSLGKEISERVTVRDWSGSHANAQPDAYNDCLQRYNKESRWIGFIDVDEQVRVKTGQTLPEFLKGYESFAGLFMVWLTYDANGQRYKSSLPLRQRFTHITVERGLNDHLGKVFVQVLLMEDMHIHNGHTVKYFDVVDENKEKIEDNSIWKDKVTTELICVDHYFTKSYEEWLEKLKRGSCDADYMRKYDEFFRCNPDMEYCRENIEIFQKYGQFD